MTIVILIVLAFACLWLVLPAIYLGQERKTGQPVYLPLSSFPTHWHLIGGTGKGKTTAIKAIIQQLLKHPRERTCHFILDRMGSFSFDLLLWFASPYCPQWVRERLVIINPAREDVVLPFNPLLYDTLAHGYYKVGRAVECILRAWASQNIEEMPRLARWLFNAFWAAAQLGLTVADCSHLLMPGSPLHDPLLRLLPAMLQAEWAEIQRARGSEAVRILESSRNRLKPYFENPILRGMFGSAQNRLDVSRFMAEGKIVLVILARQNRLCPQTADTIGGMLLNEILATARSLPLGVRYPTYVWLDEFQRYVSPDIEEAIPEVRQMGVRLFLSHQSFSQLKRGDVDLTSIIFQCQSRMIFGVQGEDADILAHEIAAITYDPHWVKDEMFSRRQMLTGHQLVLLRTWSQARAEAETWNRTVGTGWAEQHTSARTRGHTSADALGQNLSRPEGGGPGVRGSSVVHNDGTIDNATEGDGTSQSGNQSDGHGGGITDTTTIGEHETLLPVHEEFLELVRRSYYAFEEQRVLRGQFIRQQLTGQALVRLVNDPTIYDVQVARQAPGYLEFDIDVLRRRRPQVLAAVDELLEQNFASGLFVSPDAIQRETTERLERILHPAIELRSDRALTLEKPAAGAVPAQPGIETAYGY